jgi:hypothetical protein
MLLVPSCDDKRDSNVVKFEKGGGAIRTRLFRAATVTEGPCRGQYLDANHADRVCTFAYAVALRGRGARNRVGKIAETGASQPKRGAISDNL